MEVGAGTSHTATFLRALGPEPWRAAYVQPSRRPKDGRYGENPNRLHQHHQFQVVLKPSPANILELYLGSLTALGFDLTANDVRFVEDDWENPTLGAWGLGWEVWLNGMEITQFTYFQQVGRPRLQPDHRRDHLRPRADVDVPAERRVGVRPRATPTAMTYGDVFLQNEVEQSTFAFDESNVPKLFEQFAYFEAEAKRLLEAQLPLPGYEMILKAGHTFNLLDARGAISVTERAGYIGRIRTLSRLVAQAYVESREALGFPDAARPSASGCRPLPGGRGMTRRDHGELLVVELFTEELPPKALKRLGQAFADGSSRACASAASSPRTRRSRRSRRRAGSACRSRSVRAVAPDANVVAEADAACRSRRRTRAGKPTEALERKLASSAARISRRAFPMRATAPITCTSTPTARPTRLPAQPRARASRSRAGLQDALDDAIAQLPIPKVMSYARRRRLLQRREVRAARASAARAARRRRRAGAARSASPPDARRAATASSPRATIDDRQRRRL